MESTDAEDAAKWRALVKHRSDRMKALFQDPVWRAKRSEDQSERMRALWANPEWREKQAEKRKHRKAINEHNAQYHFDLPFVRCPTCPPIIS